MKLSLEERKKHFIEKANQIHQNKYDYSKIKYEKWNKKVEIICPQHGTFLQTPNNHLSGYGCKQCAIETMANKKRKNTEEFIKQARAVHGDKYDYNSVNYVSCHKKVKIKCPIHNSFEQTPSDHLSGRGCYKCGRETTAIKLSIDYNTFLKQAKSLYGDKYNYDNAVYIDYNTDIQIICPEHGPFLQKPYNHIHNKYGCPKCGTLQSIQNQYITRLKKRNINITPNEDILLQITNDFITRANIIHNNRYDYTKTQYIKNNQSVCITCKIHGDFLQDPAVHLRGCGCPDCGKERIRQHQQMDTEAFIIKAKSVHGEKYDYSEVNYQQHDILVKIKCPIHGDFMQLPYVHLTGCGCQKCRIDKSIEANHMRKGIPNPLNCKEIYDHLGIKHPSVTALCKHYNITPSMWKNRRNNGWTLEETLTIPKQMSLGEARVEKILKERKITYECNITIKTLFRKLNILDKYEAFMTNYQEELKKHKYNISRQRMAGFKYDFALLKDGDIQSLIEVDGRQHFSFVTIFFKTLCEFFDRINSDNAKNGFSEINQIPLLRIRYDQLDIVTIRYMINDLLENPDKYLTQHNTFLSEEEYWQPLAESIQALKMSIA